MFSNGGNSAMTRHESSPKIRVGNGYNPENRTDDVVSNPTVRAYAKVSGKKPRLKEVRIIHRA